MLEVIGVSAAQILPNEIRRNGRFVFCLEVFALVVHDTLLPGVVVDLLIGEDRLPLLRVLLYFLVLRNFLLVLVDQVQLAGSRLPGWAVVFNPLVVEYLLQTGSLLGVLDQNLLHEVLGQRREFWWVLELDVLDILPGSDIDVLGVELVFLWREGRFASQKLIDEHSQRPDIDCEIVLMRLLQHLWRQVVQRSAEGFSDLVFLRLEEVAPPEIRELQHAVAVQQKVFRLDIAMNDVRGVAHFQGLSQLIGEIGHFFLIEPLAGLLPQELIELAALRELENQVDVRVIFKVVVELQDVLVVQTVHDLHLV